jgi:hypothetical protein
LRSLAALTSAIRRFTAAKSLARMAWKMVGFAGLVGCAARTDEALHKTRMVAQLRFDIISS